METRSTNQKAKAEKIEIELTEKLKKYGESEHVNNSVDILFTVKKEIPIEVKSAELCQNAGVSENNPNTKRYRRPSFKVTKENYEHLVEKKGFYCFIITFKEENILELFIEADKLEIKNEGGEEYYTVASEILYDKFMLTFKEFIQRVAV